ncbi:MAG: hypothetical protein ACW99A_15380 [Candidatus Kariarchaeaceae archaeon]
MITYYNNFDKFKHKIYTTLLETLELEDMTSSVSFFLQTAKTNSAYPLDLILTSEKQQEDIPQRVGVAHGATY